MNTDNFFPCTLIYFCLSIILAGSRDPGITDSSIPDPGIEKRDPGLQSLAIIYQIAYRESLEIIETISKKKTETHDQDNLVTKMLCLEIKTKATQDEDRSFEDNISE